MLLWKGIGFTMNEKDVLMMRQVVFVFSQTVSALIRLEAMKTLNAERFRKGQTEAYTEADFEEIINDFGLGHNNVLNTLDMYR